MYSYLKLYVAIPYRIYKKRKGLAKYGILYRRYGKFNRVTYLSTITDNNCPNKCKYCFVNGLYSYILHKNQLDLAIDIINYNKPDAIFFGEKAEIGLNKKLQEHYAYCREKIDDDVTFIITTKCLDRIKNIVSPKDNTLILASMTNPREMPDVEGKLVISYSQREKEIMNLINAGYRVALRCIVFNKPDVYYFNRTLNSISGLDKQHSIISMLRLDKNQLDDMSKYINLMDYNTINGLGKSELTIQGNELRDILDLTINQEYIYDFKRNYLMKEIPIERTIHYINKFKCHYDSRKTCLHIASDSNSYKCNGYRYNKRKDIIETCPNMEN